MDTKNVTLATTCRVLEDLFCNPLDLVSGKGVLMHQFATKAFPPFTILAPYISSQRKNVERCKTDVWDIDIYCQKLLAVVFHRTRCRGTRPCFMKQLIHQRIPLDVQAEWISFPPKRHCTIQPPCGECKVGCLIF